MASMTPADLVVGIFAEAGEDFHLVGEEFLLVRAELVPVLDGLGLGASLVPAGTTPSLIWRASVSSRSLSQPWSNLPLYLAIHSFGHVVRSVRGAWGEVDEERLVRREGLSGISSS